MHYACEHCSARSGRREALRGRQFCVPVPRAYNYHRIHMPCDGRLRATRYVPGDAVQCQCVDGAHGAGTFRAQRARGLRFRHAAGRLRRHGRRVVRRQYRDGLCGRNQPSRSAAGPVPSRRRGVGRQFAKGEELGRFNMGSTVIVADREREPRVRPASRGGCHGPTRASPRRGSRAMTSSDWRPTAASQTLALRADLLGRARAYFAATGASKSRHRSSSRHPSPMCTWNLSRSVDRTAAAPVTCTRRPNTR